MLKSIFKSWSYIVWFVFHLFLFGMLTGGLIMPVYIIFFLVAFMPVSEKLWRWSIGIRPLRLKAERDRLIPLFDEVYSAYRHEEMVKHTENIKLYIQESMSINAFAFGRETLVLTKGVVDLLSDEDIKGLIAHELAHFHHYDTMGALFTYVANFPMSLLMKKLRQIDSTLGDGIAKFFFNIIFGFFRLIEFVGELILMSHSRKQEYVADMSALKWGYGEELAGMLIHLYQLSMEKPKSIREMIKMTHPPITKRIEQLEYWIYLVDNLAYVPEGIDIYPR